MGMWEYIFWGFIDYYELVFFRFDFDGWNNLDMEIFRFFNFIIFFFKIIYGVLFEKDD